MHFQTRTFESFTNIGHSGNKGAFAIIGVSEVKMTIIIFIACFLFGILKEASCFCPPLSSPQSTRLTCEVPLFASKQMQNCSTSWLPKGTIAYFKCENDLKKEVKGRIICFEDGTHRHVQKGGEETPNLPCGISRLPDKPEIHIYGYQTPIHFKVPDRNHSQDFRVFGVELHNEFRKKHGTPPLTLKPELSSVAQEWADRLASENKIDMMPEQHYGQNIFMARTGNLLSAVNDAIQNWYMDGRTEYCWEDVAENWGNSLALDFSQLVWKDTKFIGIGAATTKTNPDRAIVIALYDPSGNIVIDGDNEKSEALFRANVLPLQIS